MQMGGLTCARKFAEPKAKRCGGEAEAADIWAQSGPQLAIREPLQFFFCGDLSAAEARPHCLQLPRVAAAPRISAPLETLAGPAASVVQYESREPRGGRGFNLRASRAQVERVRMESLN